MLALIFLGEDHWQIVFFIFPVIGALVMIGFWKFSTVKEYGKFVKADEENKLTPPLASIGDIDNFENVKQMSIMDALKIRKVRSTALFGFLCQYSYIGLMLWLPLYLAYVADFSYSAAAGLSVIYAITGGLGQIIWGKLSDKIGVHKTLLICSAWLAVTFYLFRLSANGIGWIIFMQLLVRCCSNAVYPVMYKRAQDAVPDNANITATSITTTGIFIGASLATYITGLFIQLGGGYQSITGYNTGLIAMSLSMVAAFCVILISDALDKKDERKKS